MGNKNNYVQNLLYSSINNLAHHKPYKKHDGSQKMSKAKLNMELTK